MAMVNISTEMVSSKRDLWICERTAKFQHPKGIFYGDNPLNHTVSVLMMQMSLAVMASALLQSILFPLGETTFVPQLLGGLLAGRRILGRIDIVNKWVFPIKSFYVSQTVALFGCMLMLFLMGVKIDPAMVMKTGKKTWAIGLSVTIVPLLLSAIAASFIQRSLLSPNDDLYKSLHYMAFCLSSSSVHVTSDHLRDLKLLNSEVGRLALSTSMVSGTVSMVLLICIATGQQATLWKHKNNTMNLMFISLAVMVVIILCVLRPIMLWMIRQTPEGKPIKESYILFVFLTMLGCSLFGEFIGEHFMIGPVILGMCVPDGSPLGLALVERLDTLVSSVFMPMYYLVTADGFKLYLVDFRSFIIVQTLAICGFFGKVIGTMLPSMYCRMSLTDALSLGLLLSAQGITQLIYLQSCQLLLIIDDQSYCNMVISIIWLTAVTTPIVKFLYDPSKNYLSLSRRTIEHTMPNTELCLMACLHSQESTPTIINLLEMSYPTIENPICFYVLHLMQLIGRLAPIFKDHNKHNPAHSNHSDHIINAFKSYEKQHSINVTVKLFTCISPYETMHDEICMQAAEKRVCMLILPFHRHWSSNGIIESAHPIRALNRHLLRTAPCSVGILVERGNLVRNNPLTCVSFYSVGIIFIDGPDDREALAYAMRMADHPNIRVTVIRLMEPFRKSRNLLNRDPDADLIHKFKADCIQMKRHDYREEVLRDSVEMINIVRSLEGHFDLVLVGRRHSSDCSLFTGLGEWDEYPELGALGDMLVASDSSFEESVLVVQQQNRMGVSYYDQHLDSTKQDSISILEVPRNSKGWPIV